MRRLVSFIAKKPGGLSIGMAAVAPISLGLAAGMMVGYFTARFCSGAETAQRGRFRSVVFTTGTYKVHLHHWLIALCILALAAFLQLFVFAHEILYGFLGGLSVQGIAKYDDWAKIITRKT